MNAQSVAHHRRQGIIPPFATTRDVKCQFLLNCVNFAGAHWSFHEHALHGFFASGIHRPGAAASEWDAPIHHKDLVLERALPKFRRDCAAPSVRKSTAEGDMPLKEQ
jgi:hypothetical protein